MGTLLFLLVMDCCQRMLFLLNTSTVLSYLTSVMARLMKNQRGTHYPGNTTNFFFELEV